VLRSRFCAFSPVWTDVCCIVSAVSLISGLASLLFCKSVEVRKNGAFFLGFFRELGADIGFGETEVHFRASG